MSGQRHIIKRQVLELTVGDPAQARRLHDEMSRIYRQRIAPLIDQHCSAASAPGRIDRIERLELELGVVDLERLEEELVARVRAALPRALEAQLDGRPPGGGPATRASAIDAWLELLALFARTGSVPWWADAAMPLLLDNALGGLLREGPAQLRALLGELALDRRALRRLAGHFSDEALGQLVARPGAAALAPEVMALAALLLRCELAAGHAPGALRQSVWAAALGAAATGPQGEGVAPPLETTLTLLAAELEVARAALLDALRQAPRAGLLADAPALRALLEAPATEGAAPGDAGKALARAIAGLAAVAGGTSAEGVAATLAAELRAMAQLLPVTARRELLEAVTELEAACKAGSTGVPEALGQAGGDRPAETRARGAARRLLRLLQPQMPEAPGPTLDLGFSDADECFVGNAGLVILWPFLASLFTRLELIEGRRFKDIAAQQRAAGLLQYLATGAAEWPEYLLPLNKLLCGLAYDELFDFGPPLSEAEAAECDDLLAAMIAQVPLLRSMSPDGLRGSFLLRQGTLRAQDGAWLLHVERQTYDVVLEHFPWSWSWVNLPWMELPLRVTWV